MCFCDEAGTRNTCTAPCARRTDLAYAEEWLQPREHRSLDVAMGIVSNLVRHLRALEVSPAGLASGVRHGDRSRPVASVGDLLDMLRGYSPTAPLLCQVVGEADGGGAWMMLLRAAHGDECGFKWAQNPLILTMSHPELQRLPDVSAEPSRTTATSEAPSPAPPVVPSDREAGGQQDEGPADAILCDPCSRVAEGPVRHSPPACPEDNRAMPAREAGGR